MRQLKVQTAKAEARLDGLREAGIDVNKWLQKAEQTQTQSNNNDSNKVSASELTPSHCKGKECGEGGAGVWGGRRGWSVGREEGLECGEGGGAGVWGLECGKGPG